MRGSWTPVLEDGPEPLYERLLAALARDIRSGGLAPGTRLPPHRDLAHDLGIGVGTVTKAYAEAERRGLLTAHVGRGSFVAGSETRGAFSLATAPADGAIDLARNLPPAEPAQRRLADALAWARRQGGLAAMLSYAPPQGLLSHRVAVADWLRRRHGLNGADPQEIVLTNGAQQALSLAFSVLCRPGDAVLCEAATFHGLKALAEHQGYRLHGVAMDAQGLEPEALARAAAATGARVLYTIPTLQNPTGRVMGAARRGAIVDVARRYDLSIVEDDVYAIYAPGPERPVPLRALADERVWHVAGMSKALAPGLRVGFLCPPAPLHARVLRAVRAQHYAPPSFSSAIVAQWIEEGTADAIAQETIAQARARAALAASVLGLREAPCGLHLWLAMSELAAERAAGRALRAGVEVTPPSASIVAPGLAAGLRLCLGAAPDHATLERALRVVAAALSSDADEPARAVV